MARASRNCLWPQVQGKDAGYVTTGVFSPGLDSPIALGFVNHAAGEPDGGRAGRKVRRNPRHRRVLPLVIVPD